jgi:multicomponent Na+:H+ antiporter subunit D
MLPIAILTFFSIALGIGAEAIQSYVETAVQELAAPAYYIKAVLRE